MDKEKLIDILNKLVDRSERWMDDAEVRTDWNDYFFYQGQKKLAKELIILISR